uniref:Ngorf13aR protein n=1 Tax=Nicotiana glauca TaxID=4090 RepID=Q8S954_NICGL|nr:Ngorf13aR [Nicotiana glauca]
MASRSAVVRITDGQDGMLIVRNISVTLFRQGVLFAVCRRGNLRFHLARLQKVLYRCSETAPMAMLNESYSKELNVRYKPPALRPQRQQSPASSSSPQRQFVWNT